jgi:hypothetical protein
VADYKIVSINLGYLSSFSEPSHTLTRTQTKVIRDQRHLLANPAEIRRQRRKSRVLSPGNSLAGDSQKRVSQWMGQERCLLIKHFMTSFLSSRPFFSGQLNRLCLLLSPRLSGLFGVLIFDSHRFFSREIFFCIGNFSLSHRREEEKKFVKRKFPTKNSSIDCFSFVSFKTFFFSSSRPSMETESHADVGFG